MKVEPLRISTRFCGPPRSGNGGYVCGMVARHLEGAASVRLFSPPPLETELKLESAADHARLFHSETLVAEGRAAALDLEIPEVPSLSEAEAAMPGFIGFHDHPFPGCFVCGPAREEGDGLRIFPGFVAGSRIVAAPWTPDSSLAGADGHVKPEFLWSALDCTGAYAILPMPEGRAVVLGELCAAIEGSIKPGDSCVAMGWALGSEGRKHRVGSAIFAPDGRKIAAARAVWIEVPLSAWN